MVVPVVDLRRQHHALRADIERVVADTLDSGRFVGGPAVAGFERAFAAYLGAPEVVGAASGTSALTLSFRALGLNSADEVIVPANTFVATAEAVVLAGARPAICDVDAESGLLTRATVDAALTPRTRGVVPVHLFGHVVDMDPVLALARERGLFVVEDACQAHGARYVSGPPLRAGAIAPLGCFSFYPTKNLGSIGEAGAVAVRDGELAATLRRLCDHGQASKHDHVLVGDNGRLPAIEAAVLQVKLARLDAWNARRRAIADRYDDAFRSLPIIPVAEPPWSESVYHQFAVRVRSRDHWIRALHDRGVQTAVHYPSPIHLQPAFAFLGHHEGDFPAAERWSREILSLPCFPELTDEEIEHVIAAIRDVAASAPRRPAIVSTGSVA
jgi:dTDP-4-amino-4,6-dideoxygalactose transaminase